MSDPFTGRPISLQLRHALMAAAAVAAPALGCGPAARAQPAPDAAATAAGTEEGLADIVVTAQRREEKLQDVPISVTAVSADELAREHIDDISRLQNVTPGLTWGQQGSDSFPAIRGVRTSLVSAQNDPVIGFYLDGIYQSRTQQQSIPLFDLSRVEVQRGPQGTLYGRNTFGGNISVVTNDPTKAFEGAVNTELGNYGQVKVDGFVNIPLADTLDLRLSGVHVSRDGIVSSTTTSGVKLDDDDEDAGRAALHWTPTEDLDVVVRGGIWKRDDAGSGSYGYKVAGTLIDPKTGFQSIYGQPFMVNPSVHNGSDIVHGVDIGVPVTGGPWNNNWDYRPFEHIEEKYASGVISYDLGFATLRSISGYTDFKADRSADNDQSSVVFQNAAEGFGSGVQEPDTRSTTFSEEVQLASKDSTPLQWITGVYYLHDHISESYRQVVTAPDPTISSYEETTALQTNSYAGYAQAEYYIVPDLLRAIGGVRYTQETKKFAFADYFDSIPGTYEFGAPYSQTYGAPGFHRTTWRTGFEVTPDRNSMYYFTASTGFESGGVNDTGGAASVPSSYAPQIVNAYEVGAKNRFLDGRLETELSLFYNDFSNLQINVYTPQVSYFGSAGAAQSKGAELAVRSLPLRALHVDATAAYLDAGYTKYISGNNFYGKSGGLDPVSVDLSGKQIPNSPKLKTTVSVYYDFDLGERGLLSPYANWLYSSTYFTTDYNTALDKQHSYSLVDLSLRWTDASDRYYVEGYGTNITNVAVLYSGVVGRDERIQVSYGPRAFYGVRAGAKF